MALKDGWPSGLAPDSIGNPSAEQTIQSFLLSSYPLFSTRKFFCLANLSVIQNVLRCGNKSVFYIFFWEQQII